MLALSILMPVVYIPGVTGAALATGWAAMSCGLPWMKGEAKVPPFISWLAIAFGLYALWSLTWANNPITGLSSIWQLALMAGAFYVGAQQADLRVPAIGLALGFGISSLLAMGQALGLGWIIEYIPCRPSGLLFNPIILGEGCALTILLCLAYRFYWLALVLVPGLVLSQSRAALLALAVGLTLTYCRPQRGSLWAACPLTFAALIAHDTSDNFRWLVWRVLYHFLDFWGHGAGSVEAVIIRFNGQMYAPGYAHNEFLDLAYQYGVGAITATALLLTPATQAGRKEWGCYMGFLICCLFSFPLHSPPLAFIGFVVAGSLCRDWSWARCLGYDRGPRPLPWLAHPLTSHEPLAV